MTQAGDVSAADLRRPGLLSQKFSAFGVPRKILKGIHPSTPCVYVLDSLCVKPLDSGGSQVVLVKLTSSSG